MEIEKPKLLIQFFLIFRRSWDVLFFLYARRLREYTATKVLLDYGKLLNKYRTARSRPGPYIHVIK